MSPNTPKSNHNICKIAGSLLASAWELIEQAWLSVRGRLPGAGPIEVSRVVGQDLADEAELEAKSGSTTTTEAVTAALEQGVTEADEGVPVADNPATLLEAARLHDEVTRAVAQVSEEDPDEAIAMAMTVTASEEYLDDLAAGAVDPDQAEHFVELSATDSYVDPTDNSAEQAGPDSVIALEAELKDRQRAELAGIVARLLDRVLPTGSPVAELVTGRYAPRFQHLLERLGVPDRWGIDDAARTQTSEALGETPSPELLAQTKRILDVAGHLDSGFRSRVRQVVNQLNVQGVTCAHRPGPLKDAHRTAQKIQADYGGDASRLQDALRCRIVHTGDPVAVAEQAIAVIESAGMEIATRRNKRTGENERIIKNRFVGSTGATRPIRGMSTYTDVKVITVALREGDDELLAEIVIAPPEMTAATDIEHTFYEIRRSIESELKLEERRTGEATPEDDPRRQLSSLLATASKQFYSLVSGSLADRLSLSESAL